MFRSIFIAASMLLTIGVMAQTSQEGILGVWTNEDKNRTIEFIEDNGRYSAVVLSADKPEAVGQQPIKNLKPIGNNRYEGGTVYIHEKDRTAACTAKVIGEDKLKLTVDLGMIKRSKTWTRVDSNSGKE